nr:hypothetical protein JVH1_7973 [Rhodococcus sp. JVH1]
MIAQKISIDHVPRTEHPCHPFEQPFELIPAASDPTPTTSE